MSHFLVYMSHLKVDLQVFLLLIHVVLVHLVLLVEFVASVLRRRKQVDTCAHVRINYTIYLYYNYAAEPPHEEAAIYI